MTIQTTWSDTIVDEIHKIRQELLQEAGGDLESLGKLLMQKQDRHGDNLVTLDPHPPRPLRNKD